MIVGEACLAAGGGSKRRYQHCSDISGTIVYFRALQGHSGRCLIDPSLQDNVTIQCGLFHHIYYIGCVFNLHSIINNGLISGGQNSSRRQTVFFLPIDPRNKEHQDPAQIDFSVPRRAQYLHNACKKHQDVVFWVDIDLAIRKGLTFYQTRSNAIILQGTLPAYCIPKVVRLKTGDVWYEKSYMSPRPPPKISLRHDHDWTRGNDEFGSTVEQQPVGKLVQQSCGEVQHATFSQLTQRKPKPICDRSGKVDNLLKTPVLSKLTMDQGNLMSVTAQQHTQWKNNMLLKNIVKFRHSTRTTSSIVQSTRRTLTSTFQDYHVLQWNDHMASTFKIWFRRSRTTLSDKHFKVIFNNVNNSIPPAKNHKTWLKQLETSNCVNCSMWNPKHRAKHAWRTGTSASSTAHAGTSCEMERQRTRDSSSTLLTSFRFPIYYIKKGRRHGHRYGKKQGDHEYFIANSLKKKCKKRYFLGIHDRFIRDEKFRKNMFDVGRTEEMCREMDKLADEDHTHHITAEEFRVYRNNWWIRSNTVCSDTMPVRHRPDFKQALSTLRQLKHQEDTAHQRRWQSYFSSWWNWHHHEVGPSTDWSGKPVEKWLGYLFEVWFSKLMYCIITVQNSVTANSSLLSPTRSVTQYLQIQNNGYGNSTMKTMATVEQLWERSVRSTTASSQTGTTRTTCRSPAQHQWRRWRTELRRSRGAHASQWWLSHTHSWLKFWAHSHFHPRSYSWAHLFDSTSPFSSACSPCLSPSSSSTSSCSLSSTTRSSWQTCAAPLQKRVRTPLMPPPLTHEQHTSHVTFSHCIRAF